MCGRPKATLVLTETERDGRVALARRRKAARAAARAHVGGVEARIKQAMRQAHRIVGNVMAALWLAVATASASASAGSIPGSKPVAEVGPLRIAVASDGAAGGGQLPLYANIDWNAPQPRATRALLVVHGVDRNAANYFATARGALAAGSDAGQTVLLVPQFLTEVDVQARGLGDDVLRWRGAAWEGGQAALGPVPVSSFSAIDAILARLADTAVFPGLREVVLAGHSGGGQVVQRYAVVGNGAAALEARGVAVRYVVANPSSYLWFSAARPVAVDGACPRADRWKYGFEGDVPPYVTRDVPTLERRYVQRDVTYLLGGADTDPRHPALDVTCAGEAQGPYRYARGLNYVAMLRARDGDRLRQRVLTVDGVGHDERRMFMSACGQAALFGRPGCEAR